MFFSRDQSWLGLGFVLMVLGAAGTLFGQASGLMGTVKDEQGKALAGYTILIERQDIKGAYKTKTNKKGEFVYIGLPTGDYKVALQDPNGRNLISVGKHVGLGEPTQVDIDLAVERARSEAQHKRQLELNPELKKKAEEEQKAEVDFSSLKQVFDQAQALYAANRFAEAAAMFERGVPLAKEKNLPVVLSRTADSYQKAHQYDKALEYYQKAIQVSPTEASLYNNLGNVYAELGKVAEAQQNFQKAAELDPPGASRYYYNLGAIMYNIGKMDEAAAAFKKATEVDPKYADAFFMEGRALMAKLSMTPDGKVVAAPGTSEALESYLKLEPAGKYASEAQAMLQTVQGKIETQYKAAPKKKKKG